MTVKVAARERFPSTRSGRACLVRRSLLAAMAVAGLTLGACGRDGSGSEAPDRVTFSVLAGESSRDERIDWAPFFADMEKQTGLQIRPSYQSNAARPIEAMRVRRIDVGLFSNLKGLQAVRRANGEVFARTTRPSGGEGDHAVILVAADSGLTLERLLACDRSLSFGMGDDTTASGGLAPMTYLFLPHGVEPHRCFRTVRAAGHQANLTAVAGGLLDAAANNSTALELARRTQPDVAARVREIWRSPPLPQDPIVWRKDLHPSAKEKIRSFLLTYGAAEGAEGERQRAVLARLGLGGFKAADDSHLLPMREMEANGRLLEARAAQDAAAVKKAEAELAEIARERTAAGAGPTVTPAAPTPAAE